MVNSKTLWRGFDGSLKESLETCGSIYQYDGDNFNGWVAVDVDEFNVPNSFAPIWLDHQCIDDYFAEDGDAIASMCGTTQEEMDYEWKFDAMLSYYGMGEFVSSMYVPKTKAEVAEMVGDNWFTNDIKMDY